MNAAPVSLLPEPKSARWLPGEFRFAPGDGAIAISPAELFPIAESLRPVFPRCPVHLALPGGRDVLRIRLADGLSRDAYRLAVAEDGVRIEAGAAAGAFYAAQTLRQIAAQMPPGSLPCVEIDDAPDFPERGLLYDVSRGRVPKLAQLFHLADRLAHFKINQLQLYVEHTFVFRGHPDIGRGASPLGPEDILRLDAYCRDRHIELVPCLATFGHLSTVLRHPRYRHLAEDRGVGDFAHPEAPEDWNNPGWTLSPANPASYEFLDSLFAGFLPLFRSPRFNACCDEVYDLGWGQSFDLCRREGKANVFLGHVRRVAELAAKYGKSLMFWGDMVRLHADILPQIPKEFTVLDWGYNALHPYDGVRAYREAGLGFYVCPSTASYSALFPRLREARENMAAFAAAGRRNNARGMLNTDWGDGGHFNFMEFSWHGYLFGAEQSWNGGADQASFNARFLRLVLGTADPALAEALDELGDISFIGPATGLASVWPAVLFGHPGDEVFCEAEAVPRMSVRDGEIVVAPVRLDRALAESLLPRLAHICAVLGRAESTPAGDAMGLLPYWHFAAKSIRLAVEKLAAFGPGALPDPRAPGRFKARLTALRADFEKLWRARNRPGGLRFTLDRYDRAIAGDCVRSSLAEDASGTLHLTLANAGGRPASGSVKIQIIPARAASLESDPAPGFRELAPGASRTFPVILRKRSDSFRVKVSGSTPAIRGTTLAVYGDRRHSLAELPAFPVADLPAKLAGIDPAPIKNDHVTVAGVRLAKSGEALGVAIHVQDARILRRVPIWRGSCIEIFARPISGARSDIAQVFLVPASGGVPAAGFRLDGHTIEPAPEIEVLTLPAPPGGYALAARIPLASLRIPPDALAFRLEIIATATPADGAESTRSSLFLTAGDAHSHPEGFGILQVSPQIPRSRGQSVHTCRIG